MKITGNTILITGGSSGLGMGLAIALHQAGNKVIISGRREDRLKEISSAHSGIEYVVLDTTSIDSVSAAAKDIITRFPDLNVVFNNAGVSRVHDYTQDGGYNAQLAAEEIDTNIYGVLNVTDAFLSHLRTKEYSAIVNVSSGLAFVPLARYPVYCATKAFIHSYTMSLRQQLRGKVQVIELAPPWVKTEIEATHPAREAPKSDIEHPQPMPLEDFVAAAMKDLASDQEELLVADAKFLYDGGVSNKLYDTFETINKAFV